MTSFIDTKCILRYLVDYPEAITVEKLLKSKQEIILPDIVVSELVWVLLSFYGWPKIKIIEVLSTLLQLKAIKANHKLLSTALLLYSQNNIDYIDAYIIALMRQEEVTTIYSYDRHFNKVKDITRRKP